MDSNSCICCCLDLDDEQTVYYQHSLSLDWIKAKYCWETISTVLRSKYNQYLERIYQSKCRYELTNMLNNGPPCWYTDEQALPVPEGAHITKFKHTINGQVEEVSARYLGAPELEEDRMRIWNDVKSKIKERIKLIAISEDRDINDTEPRGEDD